METVTRNGLCCGFLGVANAKQVHQGTVDRHGSCTDPSRNGGGQLRSEWAASLVVFWNSVDSHRHRAGRDRPQHHDLCPKTRREDAVLDDEGQKLRQGGTDFLGSLLT